ncbi:unnamed protein product [Pleuronectes platessa]|uniref:Uncharacterized protein n=1 Tax=Pleuronectes platessa TaxID=8262 RepID=A0A9N7YR96_PLEPL|nr:unnamed protein product [Pleuronectes platessa]
MNKVLNLQEQKIPSDFTPVSQQQTSEAAVDTDSPKLDSLRLGKQVSWVSISEAADAFYIFLHPLFSIKRGGVGGQGSAQQTLDTVYTDTQQPVLEKTGLPEEVTGASGPQT